MGEKTLKNNQEFYTDSLKAKLVIKKSKSYSFMAMNLETVEDIDKAIHQLKMIREQIAGE